MDDLRVVLVTAPDLEAAERLATTVVEARLAACANVLPGVRSVYRWEGEVQRDDEVMLILKTGAERVTELVAAVVDAHPYDIPEVLALPVTEGHGAYATWVRAETERTREEDGA